MNRRTFLLGLAASASGCAHPRKHHYALRTEPQRQPTGGVGCVFGIEDGTVTQTGRSPLTFHGDTLVQRTRSTLVRWDSRRLTLAASWPLETVDCCFAQDGATVALSVLARDAWALHRIDARGQLQTFIGSHAARAAFVLPGRAPDEVFVGLGYEITQVRLVAGGVAEPASIVGRSEARVVSCDDGRIVQWGPRVGVQVLALERPATTYPLPGARVKHLAAATRDRVWYSCFSPAVDYEYPVVANGYAANLLVLTRADTPTAAVFKADFAPARITHLAAGAGAVVALVTLPVDIGVLRATLVVINDDGVGRWRADVPAAIDPGGFRLNSSFVAISEHRVILCRDDATLFAWDAATGAPLGVLR